jgi:exoribonuclease R
MNNAQKLLSEIYGEEPIQDQPSGIRGILQTKDYTNFNILSDLGNVIYSFTGAKIANKCLAGDHVNWDGERCQLELRDEHPPIVGTLELTNKSKYGLTSRGIPIYLFTPYKKCYPHFIVGCSEKDVSKNRIGIIKFEKWENNSTFPRGLLQQVLGVSGNFEAEKQALIWQASPWKYPKGEYLAQSTEKRNRKKLDGFTFNIDPEGCKDIDDVFTFKQLTEDTWQITITISDVATFVEDGSVVDIYASLIGQTLYDTNGTVLRPMLPKEYSEQTCSLIPNKESYGISLQFNWNGKEITNKEWFESQIKNDISYTYEEFQKLNLSYKDILQSIVSYLAKTEVNDSHKWVEYMMILYNTEAGRLLKESKMGILRRHDKPDLVRLEKYKKYIPELEKLAFSAAEYCLAEEIETSHFGLSSDNYTHASSPIRRYADLLNQRVLKLIINNSTERFIVPQAMYDMNLRAKAIRDFARDMDFLNAITNKQSTFKGIIMDKIKEENDYFKIHIYVPIWKRIISTTYRAINSNTVLSRDEKREIDVSDYREVVINCTFNMNSRNWKERAIINIL